MAANANLRRAKSEKDDEFYTQLTDIEKEIVHYHDQLRDKTIFCNCDDPTQSNFWRYFHLNFKHLGLKKLISTHYDPEKPVYKLEYVGGDDTDVGFGVRTELDGNGDFRSPECIELLDKSDVVVTNPPFSLFREYVAQLMAHDKKFIIIGNMNAITYKEIFPLLKDNRMWIGYTNPKQFIRPDGAMKSFGNVLWFTNLDIQKRHEKLILRRRYTPLAYPRYANFDAIEVSKVADIPVDYDGLMGVPITFLNRYDPEQFEIIGQSRELGRPMSKVAASGTYEQGGVRFYLKLEQPNEKGMEYRRLYDRLVIRWR